MAGLPILQEDPKLLVETILSAALDYEFDTFVLGMERPEDYRRELHEAAYRGLKIHLGNELCRLWPGREVDFVRAEARIDLRFGKGGVKVRIRAQPLFIGGRYRKLSRQIPACRWTHLRCRGKGCPSCNYTGNLAGPSIQELMEPAVLAHTGGEATFFHGAGREDIDVRMLGRGRPFVLEVREPRKRKLDFERLVREVNGAAGELAEVFNLAPTDRAGLIAAKEAGGDKTYRARLRFEGEVSEALAASRLAGLTGAGIDQFSPTRVMGRRGRDTLRKKRVVESALLGREGKELIWEVRATSGTYIKELISGDGGRTRPSVAELVGLPCQCAALDVLEVHWEPPWEN
ncbi:MAG: tRNA pseudouridine(54/55) synthase Pus10 [Planctomycetes bacterium]|nr:tRNA pseudouridine(54/55) synthase Pus10 [Planctomycetota bacterium]